MTIDANIEADSTAANDTDAMREGLRVLMGKGFPGTTPKKAERKQREKKVRSAVDGRTLKAKGRTAQLNVKVAPDLKQALAEHCEREGLAIADWMEATLRATFGLGGN